MRHGVIGAAAVGFFLTVGQAQAGSFEFSSTAEWETGIFASTNAGPPGFDQIQLDENIVTRFNHIWVAASGRGTVIRINTDTGAVLGEYYTAPGAMAKNPSRTTVDINGDVWVGNRDESSLNPATGTSQGSIAKISASATGPDTSTGVWNAATGAAGTFDARPWTNAGGADTSGGTSTASDPAILHYVRTPSTNNRTIAIDANNDVWVGGFGNKLHQKIDGETGAFIGGAVNLGSNSGYGGLIDSQGVLWSSGWDYSAISRLNAATGAEIIDNPAASGGNGVPTGGRSYGLGVDSQGNIWNSHYDNRVSKIDKDGNLLGTFTGPAVTTGGRGVAVTPDDNVWVALSGSSRVARFDNNGNLLATIVVGATPTGVAVDNNGKVWVTNYDSNSAMRIDPIANAVDLTVNLGSGARPYNYSDMTGSVLGGITNPTGTWRTVLNAGVSGTVWDQIFWNEEPEGEIPAGTSITIEVRAADAEGDLGSAVWQSYLSGAMLGITGQFAEVRATLTRTGTGPDAVSPILSDLRLTNTTTPIPLPASWLLLATGGLALARLKRRAKAAA